MKTYIFHGHACTHDLLVGTDWYIDTSKYLHASMYHAMVTEILEDPSNCTVHYAVHPFVDPSEDILPTVLDDLEHAVTMTPIRYLRYIASTQLEEWELIKSFNWSNQHSTGAIDTTQYVYKKLYTRVADIVSWSDFKRTIHALGCNTAADADDGFESEVVEWQINPPR